MPDSPDVPGSHDSTNRDRSPATVAVSAGRPPRRPDGPMNPPIVMASTYHAGGEVGYGRYGNETWSMFEAAVGALEGGVATSFASGLAAVSALLDLVPQDGVLVTGPDAYYATLSLAQRFEERGRFSVRRVDLTDLDAAAAAIEGADLVWAETPTNPMLKVLDVEALAARTAATGATFVVDSTFATPILMQPLGLGADVVLHSATKYLSGHSDLVLGVAVARNPEVAADLLATRSATGAVPGAVEAWLALRGLRTLHVRVERAQANAAELARRLGEHPAIERVLYPGLGAMLSAVLKGSADAAQAVAESTELWVHATSLGGVESSLERRRRWPRESTDVPDTLIRFSVGIEDVEDLWADLDAALDAGLDLAGTGSPA